MADYCDWKLRLRLRSPLCTPMQSDTLFGHLCWQVALYEGDSAIRQFLAPFIGGEPPFVLSDAFPAGLLPRPLLPRASQQTMNRERYAHLKQWEKASFLRREDFQRLVHGEPVVGTPVPNPWRRVKLPHASIDRLIDTTGTKGSEAGQFYFTEAFALEKDPTVEIYVRSLPDYNDRVVELFQRLSTVGFGRDKSVGFGSFEIESFDPWEYFTNFEAANAFVSLSTLMPASHDPARGLWSLRIKRGFVGEHGGRTNPYKRPLVQFEPGSVFHTGPTLRPYYGCMVGQIAPGMPEAVQCGLALAVPCCWTD